MKRLLYILLACLAFGAVSCGGSDDEFVVRGTVPERLNGNLIFLVPCDPESMMFTNLHFEDSIGVDSVEIKDGKFEFTGKGEYLARITVDKKVRFGTQDLLVVTAPGSVVDVVIGPESSASGTPQNDALQKWKDRKIAQDAIVWQQSQRRQAMAQSGDTVGARLLADSIRAFNETFRTDMVGIAKELGSGPAYTVLMHRYGDKK